MTSDESDSRDTSPQSSESSAGGGSVNYRESSPNTDSASDSEPVDNADANGSDADTEDNVDEEPADPESISRIERVLMDPDEILETMAYNGQEDIGQKGKAVFSLRPPFGEAVEPTLKHLGNDSAKREVDDEIHLRPFRFVVDGRRVIDQRPTRQLAVEELDIDDPDDAVIEAWIDEAMDTWKDHVRENLAESVDIFSPHGMAMPSVEYETGSE